MTSALYRVSVNVDHTHRPLVAITLERDPVDCVWTILGVIEIAVLLVLLGSEPPDCAMRRILEIALEMTLR